MEAKRERGRRFRELRERLGKTQSEFGDLFGYTNRNVSGWERGESDPPVDVYEKIAELFPGEIPKLLGMNASTNMARESGPMYGPSADALQLARDLAKHPKLLTLVKGVLKSDGALIESAESLARALNITVEGACLVLLLKRREGTS